MNDYKAASERTDADERALTPAFRKSAPAQAQHSPLPWRLTAEMTAPDGMGRCHEIETDGHTVALVYPNSDGNDEFIVRACNNAQRLVDALADCVTSPGALAERSHEYALRRLATITETAREALVEWSNQK